MYAGASLAHGVLSTESHLSVRCMKRCYTALIVWRAVADGASHNSDTHDSELQTSSSMSIALMHGATE